MNIAKLELSSYGTYSYKGGSNLEMEILCAFLSSDVGCSITSYQDWALDDSQEMGVSGNITFLEKDDDYIYLSDLYSEEENPTELKISRQQFVQLLNDWQEKACKHKPKTAIIKHENNQFTIETSDEN